MTGMELLLRFMIGLGSSTIAYSMLARVEEFDKSAAVISVGIGGISSLIAVVLPSSRDYFYPITVSVSLFFSAITDYLISGRKRESIRGL